MVAGRKRRFRVHHHLGKITVEKKGIGAIPGPEEISEFIQVGQSRLAKLGNGKKHGAVFPDTNTVAVQPMPG